MNRMTSLGFIVSYTNTYLYGKDEDDENKPEKVLIGDLEIIISTNEAHR